jgi:hypothetical protein
MKPPSYWLHTAIREAIHAHADHYREGRLDVDSALSALGTAAARFLAEIPDRKARIVACNLLAGAIVNTVALQIRTEDEISTTEQ